MRTPMSKVTVRIDPSTCILAANCVGIEPKLFQIGQESHVELTDASGMSQGTEYTFEASDAELEMIEEAVGSCPTRAISMQSAISILLGN
jgi:ferredoxin